MKTMTAAVILAAIIAAPASANPARDAIPGEIPRPAVTLHVIPEPEQTMPAVLDLFSRVGVAAQATVMTLGVGLFEAPFNPRGAAQVFSRHVAPRWGYVFRDRLGSH